MTGPNRRVEIDESKWTGQNRWVQIDRSKYTGRKRKNLRNWVKLTDLIKQQQQQKNTEMSQKLINHQN